MFGLLLIIISTHQVIGGSIANRMVDKLANSLQDEEKILQDFVQGQDTIFFCIIGCMLATVLFTVFIGCTANNKNFGKFCLKHILIFICDI